MKTILYFLISIIFFIHTPYLLRAQEVENPQEELKENDWYLTKLVIDEEEIVFIPMDDLPEITLNVGINGSQEDGYMVDATACDQGAGTLWFIDDHTFELDGFYFLAMDSTWTCATEESYYYHSEYFQYWYSPGDPLLPIFNFSILEDEDFKQLILTKENGGNQAYFQNVPLMSVDDQLQSNLVLYPNPTKSHIYIENLTEKVEIAIFDISGRKLRQQELTPSTESMDVSQLSEGVYFYILRQNGKSLKTEKLVKE